MGTDESRLPAPSASPDDTQIEDPGKDGMDPYAVLGIHDRASSREILDATAGALREKKYSLLDIAVAQKALLNPETRAKLDKARNGDPADAGQGKKRP